MPFLFYPKNEQMFGAQAPGARPPDFAGNFLIIFQKPIDKYAFLCYNNSTKEREEQTNAWNTSRQLPKVSWRKAL